MLEIIEVSEDVLTTSPGTETPALPESDFEW